MTGLIIVSIMYSAALLAIYYKLSRRIDLRFRQLQDCKREALETLIEQLEYITTIEGISSTDVEMAAGICRLFTFDLEDSCVYLNRIDNIVDRFSGVINIGGMRVKTSGCDSVKTMQMGG